MRSKTGRQRAESAGGRLRHVRDRVLCRRRVRRLSSRLNSHVHKLDGSPKSPMSPFNASASGNTWMRSPQTGAGDSSSRWDAAWACKPSPNISRHVGGAWLEHKIHGASHRAGRLGGTLRGVRRLHSRHNRWDLPNRALFQIASQRTLWRVAGRTLRDQR